MTAIIRFSSLPLHPLYILRILYILNKNKSVDKIFIKCIWFNLFHKCLLIYWYFIFFSTSGTMLSTKTHRMGRRICGGVQRVRPKFLWRCKADTRYNWIQRNVPISSNPSWEQERPRKGSSGSSWWWTWGVVTISMPILWGVSSRELCRCESGISISNARSTSCPTIKDITSQEESCTESVQNDWHGFRSRRQKIFIRQKEKAVVVDMKFVYK